MNLLRVAFYGVAGVPDGDYSLSDPATGEPFDLVVVGGKNGSGKTRFLETILAAKEALFPTGAVVDEARFVRRDEDTARVVLSWWLDDEERKYAGLEPGPINSETIFRLHPEGQVVDERLEVLFQRYRHLFQEEATIPFGVPGKLEYFAASRSIDTRGRSALAESDQRALRSQSSPFKYAFIPSLLARLGSPPGALRARFEGLLAAYCSSCKFSPAADHPSHPFVSATGDRLRPTELSASEAEGVIAAATAVLVGLDRSVIFVDRPELTGLEPARAIQAWRSLGSGSQVIAATGSLEIAALVGRERVIDLSPTA